MIGQRGGGERDFLALHLVLGAAAAELVIRELYHQVGNERVKLIGLGAIWLCVCTVAVVGARYVAVGHRSKAGRPALLIAFGATLWVLFADRFGAIGDGQSRFGHAGLVVMLVVLGIAAWQMKFEEARWSKVRHAMVTGCVLFVAAQPTLVVLRAPSLLWPPLGGNEAVLAKDFRSTTVFLLLDELNATSVAPFVALLEKRGLQVQTKSVLSVGDGTAKVIPQMFTGLRFDEPKPCSPTAVCSGQNTLDFSRVTASRQDVDVVGFFQPYCAMNGLRYCMRISMTRPSLFNEKRWLCAFWRRTGIPRNLPATDCEVESNRAWAVLVRETVDALFRAPVWTHGGLIFAHLPLPHPPGPTPGGSLQTHYQENLTRALSVVDEIVSRTRTEPSDRLKLVIFSDHPLRPSLWCKTYFPAASDQCAGVAELSDTRVPLIVAGNAGLPNLDGISTNAQVFELSSNWH